jgi:thiol-disulfide isomerase/thioredoxin
MRFGKPILVAMLGFAFAAYGFDCSPMMSSAQATECCDSMNCSQGMLGEDCCRTGTSIHAPFVQTAQIHVIALAPPDFAVAIASIDMSPLIMRMDAVLIDFWATWCQPCKKEMPGYQKLAVRYGARGFAVIGLKLDIMADTEEPHAFARRLGIRYPLAVATEELKDKFGGIEGLPTTLLYDRQGILRQKIIGFEYTDVVEKDLKPFL